MPQKNPERTADIYREIEILLEKGDVTNGKVIEHARAHSNADQFVSVFDPLLEVSHSPVIPEHYGRMDLSIVSAIVGKPYSPFVSAIDVNDDGTYVSNTYGGYDDGWAGYYDRFAQGEIWVDEECHVASMPVAWMAQRNDRGEPHTGDKYVLPLKSVLNNTELYQGIYQLCQEWIDAADMRQWFHPRGV